MSLYTYDQVENALLAYGIHIDDDFKTSPIEMRSMLNEIGIDIDSIIQNSNCDLLKRLITEEISIKPLKNKIMRGIIKNLPLAQTLIEFSKIILYKQGTAGIVSEERLTQIKYALYIGVILETFTVLIVNDKELESIIIAEIFKKRGITNPGSTFESAIKKFQSTKGDIIHKIFAAVKQISIDPLIFSNICWRKNPSEPTQQQLDKFVHDYNLEGFNSKVLRKLLKHPNHIVVSLAGNILEAIVSEEKVVHKKRKLTLSSFLDKLCYKKEPVDNTEAGLALILHLEINKEIIISKGYKITLVRPNTQHSEDLDESDYWYQLYHYYNSETNTARVLENLTPEWVNLYESWNFGFVLRQYPDKFHLVLPKLLIPSTLNCENTNNYLATRIPSLWLTMHILSSMTDHGSVMSFLEPKELDTFLVMLGENNVLYAKNYLLNMDEDLDRIYRDYIQNSFSLSLYFKIIKSIKNGDHVFSNKDIESFKKSA